MEDAKSDDAKPDERGRSTFTSAGRVFDAKDCALADRKVCGARASPSASAMPPATASGSALVDEEAIPMMAVVVVPVKKYPENGSM